MRSFASELAQYERDGYTIFRNVIDPQLIAEISCHIEWLQENQKELCVGSTDYFQLARVNNDPFWIRVASDDRLLDIAQQFVGPNIALFASGYFSKAANTGAAVLWHQDAAYWPLEPMEATSLWLAVDDSAVENGCMRVIPGTHRNAREEIVDRSDVANFLGSSIKSASEINDDDAVDVILRAGDVSIHHPNLIHGSKANTSPKRRCGLALRYIASSTRILVEDDQPWPASFFLRGEQGGANKYNPRPRYVHGRHMPFRDAEDWV